MTETKFSLSDEVSEEIRKIGQIIAVESQKQHPGETDQFSWDAVVVGKITPQEPTTLELLQTKYPNFVSFLLQPFETPQNLKLTDSLMAIGFWRNAPNDIACLQISTQAGPSITIQTQPTFERIINIGNDQEITNDRLEDNPALSQKTLLAAKEALELTGELVNSGRFSAIFSVNEG